MSTANGFYKITPEQLNKSPFQLIGKEWMLVTAQKEGRVNAMTASWGGFGVMWNKNVAYIVIRPQRFTKEFVDHADTFSLTFFDSSFKKELGYFGTVSGRDEDKIKKTGLTVAHSNETPYFTEANLVVICKKIFAQPYEPSAFIDESIHQCYPDQDYHTLYIGEITEILARK
ncbi:flavin reductase family protein [Alkaliphilus crotonatoxidans]